MTWPSAPSTITRMSGSVPEGRITIRPRIPRRSSMARWSMAISGTSSIGFFGADRDVYKRLRVMFHYLFEFGERAAFTKHDGKHLERRKNAVARGAVIEENHVAGLFASEVIIVFAHLFDYVPVADRGPYQIARPGRATPLRTRGYS